MSQMNERSHCGIGFDLVAALEDPARQFSSPESVRAYPWITVREKVKLLRAWGRRLEQQGKDEAGKRLDAPSGVYQRIGFELRMLGHTLHTGTDFPYQQDGDTSVVRKLLPVSSS